MKSIEEKTKQNLPKKLKGKKKIIVSSNKLKLTGVQEMKAEFEVPGSENWCCLVVLLSDYALFSFRKLFINNCFLIADIGLIDGQEVVVADATTPKPLICKIHFSAGME